MTTKQYNYPEIVNDTKPEKNNETFLLHALKNCEPYIFPGSASLHIQQIIKTIADTDSFTIETLNKELSKFSNLRVKIDSPKYRLQKSDKNNSMLTAITNQARVINALVDYNLIIDPSLIMSFRYELYTLLKNITAAGFADNIIQRIKQDIQNKFQAEINPNNPQYITNRLQSLTQKIQRTNALFPDNNTEFLPFINALENNLSISIT